MVNGTIADNEAAATAGGVSRMGKEQQTESRAGLLRSSFVLWPHKEEERGDEEDKQFQSQET